MFALGGLLKTTTHSFHLRYFHTFRLLVFGCLLAVGVLCLSPLRQGLASRGSTVQSTQPVAARFHSHASPTASGTTAGKTCNNKAARSSVRLPFRPRASSIRRWRFKRLQPRRVVRARQLMNGISVMARPRSLNRIRITVIRQQGLIPGR